MTAFTIWVVTSVLAVIGGGGPVYIAIGGGGPVAGPIIGGGLQVGSMHLVRLRSW